MQQTEGSHNLKLDLQDQLLTCISSFQSSRILCSAKSRCPILQWYVLALLALKNSSTVAHCTSGCGRSVPFSKPPGIENGSISPWRCLGVGCVREGDGESFSQSFYSLWGGILLEASTWQKGQCCPFMMEFWPPELGLSHIILVWSNLFFFF